jgi:hypothetical protein
MLIACYKFRMNKDWYSRFVEMIEKDGRDMKAISQAAGCGPNYVQQMVRNGKRPTVDRFLAILNVLGSASAMYVLTGHERTPEDDEFIRVVASLDPELRAEAYRFFRALRAKSGGQEPAAGPRG